MYVKFYAKPTMQAVKKGMALLVMKSYEIKGAWWPINGCDDVYQSILITKWQCWIGTS